MKYVLPFILLIALTSCSQDSTGEPGTSEAQPPSGTIVQFGVYKIIEEGEVVDDPTTSTGKSLKNPVIQHLEQTDRIPVTKDTFFGYQYRIDKLPPEMLIKPQIELRRILIHPPMTLPDGSKKTGSERMIRREVKAGSVDTLDGYAFTDSYEMVEGEWIFQIWHGDRKLIEQKFISYRPDKQKAGESGGSTAAKSPNN